jgi:hypothetical protein
MDHVHVVTIDGEQPVDFVQAQSVQGLHISHAMLVATVEVIYHRCVKLIVGIGRLEFRCLFAARASSMFVEGEVRVTRSGEGMGDDDDVRWQPRRWSFNSTTCVRFVWVAESIGGSQYDRVP